uniref:Olfactory receptor n=1 Tax=Pyxicephalus adspersus TaxID=30357 RepID=A0AAV3AKT3_PYXAD|nr:TPA: hypothetical protein GDO54_013742 [Pyxicephalus adspersus]
MDNHTVNNMFYLNAFAGETRLKGFFFVLFLIIYLITVIGNMFIFILTNFDFHLQTPMYFFLKNLSILDICYTSTTLPQMLVNFLIEHFAISLPACIIQLYFLLSLGASESSFLATMAYDRYFAICNPLRYSAIMSQDVCTHMVVGTWVVGSVYGAIHTANTFRLPFCGPKILNHYFCDIPPLLKISCMNTYINEVTVFAVGGFLMIGCFILIYKEWLLSIFYTSITPLLNPIIYSLRNKDIRGALFFLMSQREAICK